MSVWGRHFDLAATKRRSSTVVNAARIATSARSACLSRQSSATDLFDLYRATGVVDDCHSPRSSCPWAACAKAHDTGPFRRWRRHWRLVPALMVSSASRSGVSRAGADAGLSAARPRSALSACCGGGGPITDLAVVGAVPRSRSAHSPQRDPSDCSASSRGARAGDVTLLSAVSTRAAPRLSNNRGLESSSDHRTRLRRVVRPIEQPAHSNRSSASLTPSAARAGRLGGELAARARRRPCLSRARKGSAPPKLPQHLAACRPDRRLEQQHSAVGSRPPDSEVSRAAATARAWRRRRALYSSTCRERPPGARRAGSVPRPCTSHAHVWETVAVVGHSRAAGRVDRGSDGRGFRSPSACCSLYSLVRSGCSMDASITPGDRCSRRSPIRRLRPISV